MTSIEPREQLMSAKIKLEQALGENTKAYWENMKGWFKHRISKEDFDSQSRKLLPKEEVHLHNMFLLAVLTKCHMTGSATSKDSQSIHAANKAKRSKKIQAVKRKFDHRFVPKSVTSNLPPVVHMDIAAKTKNASQANIQEPVRTCATMLEIPTEAEMIGLVSVIGWEMGLDDVSDEAMSIMTDSVKVFLKNILTVVFSHRSAYKVHDGKVRYSMGMEAPNPYLLTKEQGVNNSSRITFEEIEHELVQNIARSVPRTPSHKTPVNLFSLMRVFTSKQYSISLPHSVLAFIIERIIVSLWHPDTNDLKNDQILKQIKTTH